MLPRLLLCKQLWTVVCGRYRAASPNKLARNAAAAMLQWVGRAAASATRRAGAAWWRRPKRVASGHVAAATCNAACADSGLRTRQ